MHYPKISIVTPSYNQGEFIEQTILSVINQNYPNLEYIIIDGGSTDQTVDIIKKYEKYISYWESVPDNGQTDAINKGFAKCTGDIFNWINSDDYYEPNVFFAIAECFDSHPEIHILCGKEWGFNNDNPLDRKLHDGSIISESIYETLYIGIIDQPCTFFKKNSIENYFPLEISLRYVMDKKIWWSYLLENGKNKILSIDNVFTNFRLHPSSKTVSMSNDFIKETDELKYSLLKNLNAPISLLNQLYSFNNNIYAWPKENINRKLVIANFASHCAVSKYVNKEYKLCAKLMFLVIRNKWYKLNITEVKLFLLTCILPHWFLFKIKKTTEKIF